jgi:hypothetical protein
MRVLTGSVRAFAHQLLDTNGMNQKEKALTTTSKAKMVVKKMSSDRSTCVAWQQMSPPFTPFEKYTEVWWL